MKNGKFFQQQLGQNKLLKQSSYSEGQKIKIGFFTQFLVGHPVALCFTNILLSLNSKDFEILVFTTDVTGEQEIRKNRSLYSLSNIKFQIIKNAGLEEIRDDISKANVDILLYSDVGLTGTSYYLAAHRLAKKQVVFAGHPDTTGLNTVDYFVSNKYLEPTDGQLNYTEKLVLFKNLAFSGSLDNLIKSIPKYMGLSEFKIPEGKNYYGCLQSLFKIHPDFDRILNEITILDPDALFVFTIFPFQSTVDNLLKRWKKTFPKLLDHAIFLERLPQLHYLRVAELMNVHLDTIHFGMGTTAYQVLALNKPIISWPGEFMRGRVVSSIYQHFNFKSCPLVQEIDDYAKIASTWANDKTLCNKFEIEMSNKFDEIFPKYNGYLGELEQFLKSIN